VTHIHTNVQTWGDGCLESIYKFSGDEGSKNMIEAKWGRPFRFDILYEFSSSSPLRIINEPSISILILFFFFFFFLFYYYFDSSPLFHLSSIISVRVNPFACQAHYLCHRIKTTNSILYYSPHILKPTRLSM
jgi:hypothetical protein